MASALRTRYDERVPEVELTAAALPGPRLRLLVGRRGVRVKPTCAADPVEVVAFRGMSPILRRGDDPGQATLVPMALPEVEAFSTWEDARAVALRLVMAGPLWPPSRGRTSARWAISGASAGLDGAARRQLPAFRRAGHGRSDRTGGWAR